MITLGRNRQLNDDDVWTLAYEFQHAHLHNAFRDLPGGVVWRLVQANWIDLTLLSMLAILEMVASYSIPLFLQQLLRSMQTAQYDKRPAIMFASLILALRLIVAQSAVFSLWFGRRCYERSRGEMITMLYEKTLNRKILGGVVEKDQEADVDTVPTERTPLLQGSGRDVENASTDPLVDLTSDASTTKKVPRTNFMVAGWRRVKIGLALGQGQADEPKQKIPTSMGKLLNLMKYDVYEVAQRFWEVQMFINKPLGLILSLVLVWKVIGWSCLLGVAVVIVGQIVNFFLAKMLLRWEKIRRSATDKRLQKTSQYGKTLQTFSLSIQLYLHTTVEAIRHLRWYAWQKAWLAGVMEARQEELSLKVITYLFNSLIILAGTFSSSLLPVAAFWAYTVLAGEALRIDIAFPALELFSLLQSNLREVPQLITVILNAYVAVGRLEDFMNEPDKMNDASRSSSDGSLQLKNATFAWPGMTKNVLQKLNLTFPKGLTVIFGEVAAGKTALLQALLGELDLCAGELIRSDQPVGYCSQTPWLQSMSIRDNILFFSPYDEGRYKSVLDVCELNIDLADFQHGDRSAIGENGIGLSGGQKARVALARAVYSLTDTLFLDDPLSALDQHTAETIVTKLFRGDLLKERTVLLVTHRTDLTAGIAELLIELKDGKAREVPKDHFDIEKKTGSWRMPLSKSKARVTDATDDAVVPGKFEDEEFRAHGGIQFSVYWDYIRAGKLRWWVFVILAGISVQFLLLANSWLLKEWGQAYQDVKEEAVKMVVIFRSDNDWHVTAVGNETSPLARFFDKFPDPAENVQPWLLTFFILAITLAIIAWVRILLLLVIQYFAGRKLFRVILERVSQATFRFYDVTPVGRLLNRLTSDIGVIDGAIAWQVDNFSWQAVSWITSIAVIASITPLFVLASIILTAAFVYTFLQFLPASQSLRRLEVCVIIQDLCQTY